MEKLSRTELRDAVLNDESLSDEVKRQLLDLIKTPSFGLVWEEKTEDVIERLKDELPVLHEVKERAIISDDPQAPNHVLIEADNLEALIALAYTHAEKFDAIYIDPPYNSGATDWKYNNDYVDRDDSYRHSKWLCMMEHRLRIAKQLLKPENSVLIVTIDEKEYLHLGCLLEQTFPSARIQMVSSVINPSGVSRGKEFYRTDEYIFFVKLGDAGPAELPLSRDWLTSKSTGKDAVRWRPVRRQGAHDTRDDAPNQFYPIYLSADGSHFVDAGDSLPLELHPDDVPEKDDLITIWPLKPNGEEGCWQISQESLKQLFKGGYISVSASEKWGYTIKYLAEGERKKIEKGLFPVLGKDQYGTLIVKDAENEVPFIPGTQWRIPEHSAREQGTMVLTSIIGRDKFSYPKSIHAVHDALNFFVVDKPNAKILDFFAGSGTTMHATMMLNQEDGGHRQCFLVTNNENHICEEVTYERNKRVIQGYTTPKGEHVPGLTANSLRYYRVEHTPRKHTHENKMRLAHAMTEMLQIKWNAYAEPERFGSLRVKPKYMRYFQGDEDILIIYVPEIIPYIVKEIKAMPEGKPLHVYIAADGTYAYNEEFAEVSKRIELAAIPSAYYNAIKSILPDPTEESEDYIPSADDEYIIEQADKNDYQD